MMIKYQGMRKSWYEREVKYNERSVHCLNIFSLSLNLTYIEREDIKILVDTLCTHAYKQHILGGIYTRLQREFPRANM